MKVVHSTLASVCADCCEFRLWGCFSVPRYSMCDCCQGPLYGPGLRVIRPCSKAFGVRKLPFLFTCCSPYCRDTFLSSVESLTQMLYMDDWWMLSAWVLAVVLAQAGSVLPSLWDSAVCHLLEWKDWNEGTLHLLTFALVSCPQWLILIDEGKGFVLAWSACLIPPCQA